MTKYEWINEYGYKVSGSKLAYDFAKKRGLQVLGEKKEIKTLLKEATEQKEDIVDQKPKRRRKRRTNKG